VLGSAANPSRATARYQPVFRLRSHEGLRLTGFLKSAEIEIPGYINQQQHDHRSHDDAAQESFAFEHLMPPREPEA
jgi:hypothetical protein